MSWLGDVKGNQNRKEEEKKKYEQEIRSLNPMVCRVLDEVGRTLWGGVHFTTMFPFIMSSYSVHAPDQYKHGWELRRGSESCKVDYVSVDGGKFSVKWENSSTYAVFSEYSMNTSEDSLKNVVRAVISRTHYLK